MKKGLLSVLCVLMLVGVSQAQDYKPFKFGFGMGYASPGSGGGGILVDFEPAYRINDAIAVGLRIEAAVMARVKPDGSSASASANGSYTLNGQYYLSNNTFRPYVGTGLGIFSVASFSGDAATASGTAGVGNKMGFYPRIGFDLGHFNLNLDYNLVAPTEALTVNGTGQTTTTKIKNSYLGFRIGFFLFGGKR